LSRAQENATDQTAGNENQTYNANAQNAFDATNSSITTQQGDIGDYENQLSTFAAANPYGAGGAYQTAVNQSTANTADAASQAAAQAAQAAAVRTGGNASGGVAAGQATDQENARNLMATQAKANADRISQGAQYGAKVLQASEVPATLQGAVTGEESKLAGTEAGAGNDALSIQQRAGQDPSFLDELGEGFAQGLGKFAGSGGR
jgi:hypothetical protein